MLKITKFLQVRHLPRNLGLEGSSNLYLLSRHRSYQDGRNHRLKWMKIVPETAMFSLLVSFEVWLFSFLSKLKLQWTRRIEHD